MSTYDNESNSDSGSSNKCGPSLLSVLFFRRNESKNAITDIDSSKAKASNDEVSTRRNNRKGSFPIFTLKQEDSSTSLSSNEDESDLDDEPSLPRKSSFRRNQVISISSNSNVQGLHQTKAAQSIKPKPHVHFSTVSIRRHKLILGDNPYCSFPLGLDWAYFDDEDQVVDLLVPATEDRDVNSAFDEENKLGNQPQTSNLESSTSKAKQSASTEPLTVQERRALLLLAGYTKRDIMIAEHQRCVRLATEWAYRPNRKEECVCSCPNAEAYIHRYVV